MLVVLLAENGWVFNGLESAGELGSFQWLFPEGGFLTSGLTARVLLAWAWGLDAGSCNT